jgi:F0F1-type ATP synthase epsilon subunit
MAKTFHLTVARVGENLFDGEAISATLPGSEGVFQILAEHEAFVSELKPGEMHVKAADEQVYHFELPKGGVAEVSRNQATILL